MTTTKTNLISDPIFISMVKAMETELDDVMEIVDIDVLKAKYKEVEIDNRFAQNELNQTRLGIVYHEVALNLSFLTNSNYKGYAKKSFDILNTLFESAETSPELLPFISSYRASALSLVASESKKLGLISKSFVMFQAAVDSYASITAIPEFMRGSVAENLPWIFFKSKFAKIDFQSIIEKYEKDNSYAHPKLMSFTYWAWANRRQSSKYRDQALKYLEKAILLDTNYQGGRERAEKLKSKLNG